MTRGMGKLVAWLTVAGAAALVAPRVSPLDRTLHPAREALAFGCVVGAVTFLVLARRWITASAFSALPPRRLLARGVVLTAKSAEEEALWRALLLGVLVRPVGAPAALVISTVLFAAAHVGRLGRRAWAHLLTGGLFGVAYLATGRLLAAVAAHGTYNVLVGVTPATDRDMSTSDTGRTPGLLVASVAPSADPASMPEPTVTPSSPLARLTGVSKSFGPLRALDGFDLELRRGEIVALLGPNGAGKSTAMALMLGLRRPDDGTAELHGRDPRDPRARLTVGAVLQEVGFPPGLRVRETVELVAAHFPSAASTVEILERLGLSATAERHAAGLSGGQRRRLAVALALAGRPEILFLDEPTAGMDAGARRALLRDLSAFAQGGGAVLLTTQQLAEAEAIATRVVLLVSGRAVHEGTVSEVRAHGGLAKVAFRTATLPRLAGIASLDSRGDRHVVLVQHGDAFVAELVRSGIAFRELEVTPVSLEDAIVTLTEAAR